jgi:hypothetical protein
MNGATKPGWQTTEFWLSLVAVVVSYLAAQDLGEATVEKVIAIIAVVLASLGYSASRAVVKKAQLQGPPKT